MDDAWPDLVEGLGPGWLHGLRSGSKDLYGACLGACGRSCSRGTRGRPSVAGAQSQLERTTTANNTAINSSSFSMVSIGVLPCLIGLQLLPIRPRSRPPSGDKTSPDGDWAPGHLTLQGGEPSSSGHGHLQRHAHQCQRGAEPHDPVQRRPVDLRCGGGSGHRPAGVLPGGVLFILCRQAGQRQRQPGRSVLPR